MIKFRFLSAGLLLLLVVGAWVGCGRVKEEEKESLIQWTPAGAEPYATKKPAIPVQKKAQPVQSAEQKQEITQAIPAPPPTSGTPNTNQFPEGLQTPSAAQVSPPDEKSPSAGLRILDVQIDQWDDFPSYEPPSKNLVPTNPSKEDAVPTQQAVPDIQAVKEVWPPAGPEVLVALARVLAEEKQSSLGYRVNDLVIGKIFENGTNQQQGELRAVQEYLKLLLGQAKPLAAVGPARETLLLGDLEKFWFPSAEKTLGQGVSSLQNLGSAVKAGRVALPGDPAALHDFLELSASLLETEEKALAGDDLTYTTEDNVFYHARGVARAAAQSLRAGRTSYAAAIEAQGVKTNLDLALQWLDQAAAMDPLIVLQGGLDDFRSNHLLLLAFSLEKSRQALKAAEEENKK